MFPASVSLASGSAARDSGAAGPVRKDGVDGVDDKCSSHLHWYLHNEDWKCRAFRTLARDMGISQKYSERFHLSSNQKETFFF